MSSPIRNRLSIPLLVLSAAVACAASGAGFAAQSPAAPQATMPAFRPGHYVRPAYCKQFPVSSYMQMFKALDTNHDGYLSPQEFQVHRNEMHGPGVPQPCRIAYDPGAYKRLSGPHGMTPAEFMEHIKERIKRAAMGPPPPGQGHF